MQWTNLIVFVLQILISIAGILAWRWLKDLPASMHKQHQQILQHELNSKLEQFKSELSHELESMKISQAELQVRKTEEFINFGNLQRDFLTDKSLLENLKSGNAEVVKEIQKEILDLSTGLFFFEEKGKEKGTGQIFSYSHIWF